MENMAMADHQDMPKNLDPELGALSDDDNTGRTPRSLHSAIETCVNIGDILCLLSRCDEGDTLPRSVIEHLAKELQTAAHDASAAVLERSPSLVRTRQR